MGRRGVHRVCTLKRRHPAAVTALPMWAGWRRAVGPPHLAPHPSHAQAQHGCWQLAQTIRTHSRAAAPDACAAL
jgi:hypothetical protein